MRLELENSMCLHAVPAAFSLVMLSTLPFPPKDLASTGATAARAPATPLTMLALALDSGLVEGEDRQSV